MAKRMLIAQAVVLGVGLVALAAKEIPGMIREIRIYRMVYPRRGSSSRRAGKA
ncbi:hypothetical protein [Saccharopolyspora rectivirgula]|jgi:hypothetical protein|uniref:hypothetical protein n=1 Tax=Saccharopolyspora rectivirgula TaxID=28042 RepID=UPI000410C6C7|nr:hypothetical protein [Saccharopolyspora rectivirgula]MCC5697079.1 hypothetical protein [Klebsiella pneumoniae]